MFIDAEVSNGVLNTNYRFITPAIRTFEYENDDTGSPSIEWVGLIETFDQSANNLNSNILSTENTEVKVTFTALTGLISGVPLYAVPRIEEFQQGGLFNIFELSTFRSHLSDDNPLIPKTGQNKATFTVFSDHVEVEFAVDFTKLNPGSQYKISCRLGTSCNDITGCAWQSKNSGVTVVLRGIDFITNQIGLACGDGGVIIKTTDGGETWVQKTSFAFPLRDIQFSDSNTAYTCGGGGFVLKSTNAGETWADKSPPTSTLLFDLSFIDQNTGWVCGGVGRIFKTTDGGDTWVNQTISVGFSFFFSIFFIDSNKGWVVGNAGTIFTTNDGGSTWTTQSGGIGALEEIMFVDPNNGWIIGFSGTILLTTDGGSNWTPIQIVDGSGFKSVYFSDANNGIVCASIGKIYRSSDGGNTWIQQTSGFVNNLHDAITFDSNSGVVCGTFGALTVYECVTTGCDILQSGKLKEDGTQKLTESGNNKVKE